LFWIVLIFTLSSTIASASQTSRVIEPILRFFSPSASPETLKQLHFFIRKCAHFTEYALLAFWAIRAWRRTRFPVVRNYRFILAVVLVLIVASADEFNQSFEPSRTSTPWDVALDVFGGTAMAIVLKLLSWRKPATEPAADADA
jgi:VanZ family protein